MHCLAGLYNSSWFESTTGHFVALTVTVVHNWPVRADFLGRPCFHPTLIWTCSGMKLKAIKNGTLSIDPLQIITFSLDSSGTPQVFRVFLERGFQQDHGLLLLLLSRQEQNQEMQGVNVVAPVLQGQPNGFHSLFNLKANMPKTSHNTGKYHYVNCLCNLL